MSVDFLNLSNGLACCNPRRPHFLRIQSTWCEQKLWADVLASVGPDFLYHLAAADEVVVHDVSERPRPTRALWQGLPWVVYAAHRIWGLETDASQCIRSRSGMNVTSYFENQLHGLPERLIRQVRYFGRYVDGAPAGVITCDWPAQTGAVYREL